MLILGLLTSPTIAADHLPKSAEIMEIDDHRGFLYRAPTPAPGQPWVWFAPTIRGMSIALRRVYFESWLRAGISIAGYDLGEVRGAPASTQQFTSFYQSMVDRGFSPKPILLGQSRGGLMLLSWAVANPQRVRAFVGIYPVCNLTSWPLKNSKTTTLADFAMAENELLADLPRYNPIDKLQGLLANQVPMFIVHGDSDSSVPYSENSEILKERYAAGGGVIQVKLIAGEGHKASASFFECRELLDFVNDVGRTEGRSKR
jgi:pimeloyl-ACP methyl ester carboxylesterase